MELALAPLQTYTDYHFRNALVEVYQRPDKFYAPYLKLLNDGTIKPGPKLDILPENNSRVSVIPQVMCCNAEEFFILHDYIQELGYSELNWNMGCPYPMVTRKNWGAGILNQPEELDRQLNTIFAGSRLKIGIKMRMGMESTDEIFNLIPIINKYPLTEIIIHARYANQLYNGGCDISQFKTSIREINHSVVYNGDIDTMEGFAELTRELPDTDRYMIGRGAVKNPGIFEELKSGILLDSETYRKRLITFSRLIESSCLSANSNEGYALMRLISYWESFCEELSEGKFLYRKLKKSSTLPEFWKLIADYLEI